MIIKFWLIGVIQVPYGAVCHKRLGWMPVLSALENIARLISFHQIFLRDSNKTLFLSLSFHNKIAPV